MAGLGRAILKRFESGRKRGAKPALRKATMRGRIAIPSSAGSGFQVRISSAAPTPNETPKPSPRGNLTTLDQGGPTQAQLAEALQRLAELKAAHAQLQLRAQVPAVQAQVPVPRTEARRDEGGLTVGQFLRPSESLRQSLEGFLLDQRSPHTQRAYGSDLKRFAKYLLARSQTHGLDEPLGRAVVVGFKDWLLTEGLEHTTVDRQLATLRSVFAWLTEEGWMERNPADKVRFLNPRRISSTVGFSDEEVRRILALPDLHTRTGAQHYAILMILFYCGLRRSEVCALRTSNIGMERGHPLLRLRGKGNKERIVVLRKEVWHAIKYHLFLSRKDPSKDAVIFSPFRNHRTGALDKPLDPSMIFYIVTRYAKKAGIQSRVSPHSCRATAISNARDRKVPDRAIQEFAGWSSPAMIIHYDKRRTAVEESAAHAIHYGAEERELPPWLRDDSEWPSAAESPRPAGEPTASARELPRSGGRRPADRSKEL